MDKQDVVFVSEGTELVGWIALPVGALKHPLIILTHGLSGIIDLDLERYAEIFTAAGFACLAYDHRNWGRSAGWPRGESDPWRQVADLREAISYARTLPEIDPERIALWGTSCPLSCGRRLLAPVGMCLPPVHWTVASAARCRKSL